jgi:hypothetical protein
VGATGRTLETAAVTKRRPYTRAICLCLCQVVSRALPTSAPTFPTDHLAAPMLRCAGVPNKVEKEKSVDFPIFLDYFLFHFISNNMIYRRRTSQCSVLYTMFFYVYGLVPILGILLTSLSPVPLLATAPATATATATPYSQSSPKKDNGWPCAGAVNVRPPAPLLLLLLLLVLVLSLPPPPPLLHRASADADADTAWDTSICRLTATAPRERSTNVTGIAEGGRPLRRSMRPSYRANHSSSTPTTRWPHCTPPAAACPPDTTLVTTAPPRWSFVRVNPRGKLEKTAL